MLDRNMPRLLKNYDLTGRENDSFTKGKHLFGAKVSLEFALCVFSLFFCFS